MKCYKNKSKSELIDKQWLTMTHPAATGVQGKVLATVELLTLEEALNKPGSHCLLPIWILTSSHHSWIWKKGTKPESFLARFLSWISSTWSPDVFFSPEPVRPETSFNPFRLDKFASKIIWGQNKKKIIGQFACTLQTTDSCCTFQEESSVWWWQ